MLKLLRDGEHVSVEVSRNGSKRGSVLVWRKGTEETLITDEANLISAREREELISGLPEEQELRDDCARVFVDLAIELARAPHEPEGQGTPAEAGPFAPLDPWDEPVDGAELLDELLLELQKFVILPPHAVEPIVLWLAHTYAIAAADYTPYLLLTSPVRECGKSTVLELLFQLAYRAQLTGGISAAGLYRRIDRLAPTMLLDELDTRLRGDGGEMLRGVLNTGFHRSGTVTICVGDEHTDTDFSTFCPKVLSGIGRVWDTVTSRSIPIRMQRAKKGELKGLEKIRGHLINDRLLPFRRRLLRWSVDALEALTAADPQVPDELGARQGDVWRPLLAIADHVGGRWPQAARDAARHLHRASEAEGDWKLLLLEDLRAIFAEQRATALSSASIVNALNEMEHRPWPEYTRDRKPISASAVAKLLSNFEIRPDSVRETIEGHASVKTLKGYHISWLQPAWDTYLPRPEAPNEAPKEGAEPGCSVSGSDVPSGGSGNGTLQLFGGQAVTKDVPAVPFLGGVDRGVVSEPDERRNGAAERESFDL